MKKFLMLIIMLLLIPPFVFADQVEVELEKCVDGDTAKFKFESGDVLTYRFLAIDTPETVHPTKGVQPYGKEASEYTCTMLTNAKKIVLEHDDKASKTDKYGRGLAWIFVDDVLLQENLVSKGLAEVAYLYGDYKYNDLLKDTENVAKINKVGIWSITDDDLNTVTSTVESKSVDSDEKSSFINKIIDMIVEKITASISNLIDSILKEIEDMI